MAPARSASNRSRSSRLTVSISTTVLGDAAMIRAAARIPPPGIRTSSRQTSGRSATAAATASSAEAASAQTSQSPRSSAARTPARVGGWSSAISTPHRHGSVTSIVVPAPGEDATLNCRPATRPARACW